MNAYTTEEELVQYCMSLSAMKLPDVSIDTSVFGSMVALAHSYNLQKTIVKEASEKLAKTISDQVLAVLASPYRRPQYLVRPTPAEGDDWLDARVTMRRTDIETTVTKQGEWVAIHGRGNRADRCARKHLLGSLLSDRQREQNRQYHDARGRLSWHSIASVWRRGKR